MPDGLVFQSCRPHDRKLPSVAFDGKSFVLAWRALSVAGDASSRDLYAAELNPEGEVLRQYAISEEPGREGAPFLAAGGEGQVLAEDPRGGYVLTC